MEMNKTDEEREKGLAKLYFRKTGKVLDWNNLALFTEKLQWYKLYYDHPDLGRIVDKVGFKSYIAEKLGAEYVIPLIGAWTRVEDIPWETLPKSFVLKGNLQSNGKSILIVKDKDEIDYQALKPELETWLKPQNTLIASFCRAYYDTTPMILAEEYKENVAGDLFDYKIFCFNGKPECAYAVCEHFSVEDTINDYPITFYDLDWNKMDVRYDDHPNKDMPKPKHFEEMIRVSEILSKDFPFVRVDFFDTDEKLYLSELTFYPTGGYARIPIEMDKAWGEKFILPPKTPLGRKFRTDFRYID
ncbi:MAG: hypothetical protein IKN53_00615 [Oscillibacter sp.]|nr:hypothetical protein [Oscillibacter sp.]